MIECAHCQATAPKAAAQGWTFARVTMAPIVPTALVPPETLTCETLCPACTARARGMIKDSNDPAPAPEADN